MGRRGVLIKDARLAKIGTRDLNPTVRALASIILIVFLIMTMRLGQNGLVKGWTRKKRFLNEFSPFLVSVTTFE